MFLIFFRLLLTYDGCLLAEKIDVSEPSFVNFLMEHRQVESLKFLFACDGQNFKSKLVLNQLKIGDQLLSAITYGSDRNCRNDARNSEMVEMFVNLILTGKGAFANFGVRQYNRQT